MKKKLIIVGGGFGGLTLAQELKSKDLDILLIDKTNHHLFQPLLYQVAMAGLAPSDIASPLRSILRDHKNVEVRLGEVTDVNLVEKSITVDSLKINYDYLVLAPGMTNNYHQNPAWEEFTYGLKTLEDAVKLRNHILTCFEKAEKEPDPIKRSKLMRFVICGGGPTGVEISGAIQELCRFALAEDFKNINLNQSQVLLIERGPRVLASFSEKLSESSRIQMQDLGVQILFQQQITKINEVGVHLADGSVLSSSTVIWAAGVKTVPLISSLPVEKDRGGRVKVLDNCSIPGYPDVYVIGDAALVLDKENKPLPGVSPVAIQQAKFVAKEILNPTGKKFKYLDKGSMATIGRKSAVADLRLMSLTGPLAWVAWLMVHLIFLIGFRNKVIVLFNWVWSYFTYKRGARLITEKVEGSKTPKN